jgi:hypothetical protein
MDGHGRGQRNAISLAASQHYHYRLVRSHHAGQGVRPQAENQSRAESETGMTKLALASWSLN